jgi:hypothetical protein
MLGRIDADGEARRENDVFSMILRDSVIVDIPFTKSRNVRWMPAKNMLA